MTFQESIPLAKKLAENALSKGFDVEAFLVLAEIQKLEVPVMDVVPESTVDEGLQGLLQLFVQYMQNRTSESYSQLLLSLQQILSELYHTTNSTEQKQLFKTFVTKLQQIN